MQGPHQVCEKIYNYGYFGIQDFFLKIFMSKCTHKVTPSFGFGRDTDVSAAMLILQFSDGIFKYLNSFCRRMAVVRASAGKKRNPGRLRGGWIQTERRNESENPVLDT